MFSSGVNYTKLKTNLRLAINRLKLLEKKKSELAQKARKEIADYISDGKYERAKIRVEHIIREDYMVEAMEILEMYCDLLLSRFGMLQEMKNLDSSLAEAVSSLLWVAPRLGSEVGELKVISDHLTAKFGKKYTDACRVEGINTISEKLRHKLSVQAPPKILVEKYLIEIAKIYNINYEPDPQVMREHEQAKGMDALLFDSGPPANNLDVNGASLVRPTGFIGYPQPPLIPDFQPFNYPLILYCTKPANTVPGVLDGEPPTLPSTSAPFSYNIPPSADSFPPAYDSTKTINPSGPTTSAPADTNKQTNDQPKPMPRSKMTPPDVTLPELPSVPSDSLTLEAPGNGTSDGEDDFEDIARRFEELKRRK
ncbi:hypothetical protein AAG570_011545 [Ranatra chinensis]|uniref:IST1 homolog n=1 Tax=Ranatra chinensis TaxID=642074 RepID=A0ABD0YL58_9HEMI